MKKLIIIAILIPVFMFSQNKKTEKKIVQNALQWLTQLDNGQYFESWETSSIYLKKGIEQYRWASALKISREPFGDLLSRKVSIISYSTQVPGLPDGEYVIVEFEVSYENKNKAIEKTILAKEKEKTWMVAKYIIK